MSLTAYHQKIKLLSIIQRSQSATLPIFIDLLLCWHQWQTQSWMQHINAFQCSRYSPKVVSSAFLLTIFPFGIDGNRDEKHLSSKNTKYTNLLHQSIFSSFSSNKHHTTCSHFFPIILHRIFCISVSPPLTSR